MPKEIYKRCPKCNCKRWSKLWKHPKQSTSGWAEKHHKAGEEFFEYTCTECGFIWTGPVKDA